LIPVGGLFFGIGGIELGLERTGHFKTKWAVENDEFCRSIIRKHWPDIPIYGDIREIDWNAVPRVDMLTGGFPCQDISTANPRGKGIEGSRSGLWKEYAKAIGILRPRYALVENVPAIVRKGLDVVLADLAEAGYDAEWFDLRASDFGALHKRERIFVVAYPNSRNVETHGEARNRGEVHKSKQSKFCETINKPSTSVVAHHNGNGLDGEGLPILSGGSRQDNPRDKDGAAPDPDPIARHGILSGQLDNAGRVVADAIKDGRRKDAVEQPLPLIEIRGEIQQGRQAEFITDDWRERIQRFVERKIRRGEGFSAFKDVRRVENLSGRPDIPEPLFRGARDGVPDWVDRIRALGNAVVPDCAEFIGEMIMEFDKRLGVNP